MHSPANTGRPLPPVSGAILIQVVILVSILVLVLLVLVLLVLICVRQALAKLRTLSYLNARQVADARDACKVAARAVVQRVGCSNSAFPTSR